MPFFYDNQHENSIVNIYIQNGFCICLAFIYEGISYQLADYKFYNKVH